MAAETCGHEEAEEGLVRARRKLDAAVVLEPGSVGQGALPERGRRDEQERQRDDETRLIKCTRQGLSFCEKRIRCTDCGEIFCTIPSRTSERASSAHVHSDSDRPAASGSSQASFIRCVATSGGKAGWTPAARIIFEAEEPLALEALGPLANDPALHLGLAPHRGHGLALREQQDHSRPDHLTVGAH